MEEGDYIVSVKILEVNDLTETSDAFVEMELNGVKKRTKVIKKTNSPIFN
jgi:Ca2+-dependent lipid-binding protein